MYRERLSPELVRTGYEQGAFPMGDPSGEVQWYQPYIRAIFPMSGIRVSRSLAKTLRQEKFEVTFDTCFEQVMLHCLRPTDNWINDEIIDVYTAIHREGWGHSCESWIDGELVGGVYGIAIGACFCAESMFHRATDGSKVALKAMVDRCRELNFQMFDAQLQNPHLASLGSIELPQRDYMRRLRSIKDIKTAWS